MRHFNVNGMKAKSCLQNDALATTFNTRINSIFIEFQCSYSTQKVLVIDSKLSVQNRIPTNVKNANYACFSAYNEPNFETYGGEVY